MKKGSPKAPRAYRSFVARYPKLGEAWESVRAAEEKGPLDAKTARLIKLAVAIGAAREGAVHSAARKARAAGASRTEMEQVIALCAATVGFPATVAADTWVRDVVK